jgi:glycosyltransferase involved in cell wall biosynthesis
VRLALVNLTGGGLSGGYQKYLRRLAPLLRNHRRIEALQNFVPSSAAAALGEAERDSLTPYPPSDAIQGFPWLRAAVRRFEADAVFVPTARWLDFAGVPTVVMVRNMEPLVLPFAGNSCFEAGKNLARAWAAKRACRRADRVVAVSGYVKSFLEQKWKLPAEKLDVVFHGVDAPGGEMRRPRALASLDAPFVFAAGSIRPARGLEDLIRALAILREEGAAIRAVIAGDTRGANFEAHFRRLTSLADRLSVGPLIVWAGQLDPAEMAWCYRHARVFAMTSRVEACPNTSLEAMSHGCLCVSTDSAPMPEIFGKAALFYRAGDARGLADRIRELLSASGADSERLAAIGASTARRFDWSDTVEATIDSLLRATARSQRGGKRHSG